MGLMALVILLTTILYSNYLANRLQNNEDILKSLYLEATEYIATNDDFESDIDIPVKIRDEFPLPIIWEQQEGIVEGNNWGEDKDTSSLFLRKKIDQFVDSGDLPLEDPVGGGNLYVFSSPIVQLIKFFPLVQFLLVSMFVALGYFLFNTARKAEQNRVWAGMAKETAHQLGTPISAIIAWIEHLKEGIDDDEAQMEVVKELENDVVRLELIADRFSKIGSEPELERTDIFEILENIKSYMSKRASRRVEFDFPSSSTPIFVDVNKHLFSWVLENIIRNALDAMDGSGKIAATVYNVEKMIALDISDSGRGIPSSKFKTVFKPGFSTKARGWGLGLSLAKRIIENYHKGKIFVKASKLNHGTTFSIHLPSG